MGASHDGAKACALNPDLLAAERHAFLAAVTAATAAATGAAHLVRKNFATEVDGRDVLKALRHLAEKHTNALAALDRFFQRGASEV
jgi:hypothetical protein